ncbi:hypothetical protein [Aeromicrobium sp. Leaf350]|uniref:hypothetical protein n=1 Tax=Aeromicrobium sp. Leaf350 TaxID=2876565 RepID=UPI001E4B7B6F|nr:hypothetical protein [Aeromicrobium sp. Leaf350]
MHAPKYQDRTVQATPQSAFDAVLGLAQAKPYELRGVNNELHRLLFLRGKTALSWGTIHLVEVTPDAAGAKIAVTVGGRDDAPKALMDGWKHSKAATKLLDAAESVLAGSVPAPHTPMESHALLDDGRTVPWTGPDFPTA